VAKRQVRAFSSSYQQRIGRDVTVSGSSTPAALAVLGRSFLQNPAAGYRDKPGHDGVNEESSFGAMTIEVQDLASLHHVYTFEFFRSTRRCLQRDSSFLRAPTTHSTPTKARDALSLTGRRRLQGSLSLSLSLSLLLCDKSRRKAHQQGETGSQANDRNGSEMAIEFVMTPKRTRTDVGTTATETKRHKNVRSGSFLI